MRSALPLAAGLALLALLSLALAPGHSKDAAKKPEAKEGGALTPQESLKRITVPDGFRVSLFAGEPDVVQPIAMTFDDRGRLWVIECLSYPQWTKQGEGHDRVVIYDDPDGTGRFKTRKVFYDRGTNLSGIALGFGGVWLCSLPNIVFIPSRDGESPDGPPQVVLDGWDMNAKHNVFSSLAWGPDGWLYGCNGIMSNSKVGKPGTPDAERVPINCGVWRYHPTRGSFEVVANGTTNPWGLDFDDLGQIFITNCVIKHLFHVVPGAHFERMYGQDFNPHLYGLMVSCADHIHWGGGNWTTSRGGKGEHDIAGGGHAHVGAMVYLGDNWPESYRNHLFTCNLHGSRVNHDSLQRHGSGYVARHEKDFLMANDPWFRGISIQYGPDGGVFISDWYDTGECHNYTEVDRTNGRIYKVTHGDVKPFREDLAKLTDADLVKRHLHRNDWHVRHARRLLQERAAAGKLDAQTSPALQRMLREHTDPGRRLRALWTLYVIGGLDEALALECLSSPHEAIRAWAVRLSLDERKASAALLARLAEHAANDPSLFVRLHLASALQRLPLEKRWKIAEGLASHAEDAKDDYLPLMIWYAIEPLVPADPARAAELLGRARIPLVREYLARRLASLVK
jgi:putative membrane-bound dehydrogenase-like protein